MIFGNDVTGATLASALRGIKPQPVTMKPTMEAQAAHCPEFSIWNPD
jgi:hypothetical protein